MLQSLSGWMDSNAWVEHWSLKIAALVLLTLILLFLKDRILGFLLTLATNSKTRWDDVMISATRLPLGLVILVIFAKLISDILFEVTGMMWLDLPPVLQVSGFAVALAWALINLARAYENMALESGSDPTTINLISKLAKLTVVFLCLIFVLQNFGYSMSGVLAFGGVGGIAIGFAAKDLLANFFGGVMIHLDRPFKVGDWIRSPDRSIEGTVESIGWRICRIRTFDKRPLYIPNGIFNNIIIENPSRMKNRRLHETIGIRYSDIGKMEAIINDSTSMLKSHPGIDAEQTMIVSFNHFNESSLDFFIYTFTKTTDWIDYHAIKQDILLKLAAIIDHHKAEIAFPTSTLHIEQGTKSLEQADH